ncbi:uncharacterized protein LOC124380740 isoform X2 [Silurus meridionalis]|uniref:uncharacterized protein LOC124380740 isoform X2 n=1 Tax=Silurus meridionalis TaxID=175797 RepID=UPI001EEA5BD4|nr:uncharacterized protein LOC124380740 isoform X2 [Silurus meridionalis]XP_046697933.1 uncharacterized protein LOC124380740 isoform X2 [Silurus meridionalis]
MQSCSIHHCILFSFTLTLSTVPALATVTPVTVKLHQSAKLLCKGKCSGVVKWTMFHNPDNVLAQCDQTSCSSVDGYKMFHDEYVKGDLSLTITAADYTHRGLYTCNCNSMDIRDVRLSIETLKSSVELNPGEDLLMDLPVPQPLEVIYKPKDSSGLYGEQICTVAHQILQCKAEYTPRASLSYPNITLRDIVITDSGIYTIRDAKNDEDIHIYTLTVREHGSSPMNPLWLGIMIVLLFLIVIIMVAVFVVKNRRIQRLKQEKADLEETIQLKEAPAEESRQRSYSDTKMSLWIRQMLAVEKLIQQYKTHSVRRSQSWTTLNDVSMVEVLKTKMAEMDEDLENKLGNGDNTIGQWWNLRRPELDTIIEQWKMYDVQPAENMEQCSR